MFGPRYTDLFFLDEPTAGVDVHGRDTIRGIVRGLAQQNNTGVSTALEERIEVLG